MGAKRFRDRWQVVRQIGEGGQGRVYEVRDLDSDTRARYVLKQLKNINRLDRFQKEIEAQRSLDHEGIAPVIDFSLDPPAFFVAPYYDGTTLEELAPLKPLRALELFQRLCEIVAYAHGRGVIHRDLKPENVIVEGAQRLVVLDFGLCYFEDEDARLTPTAEVVGSRYYMAPELEGGRADAVTAAADSYSLGKIAYFLLTAKNIVRESFQGDNDLATIAGNPQLKYVSERIVAKSVIESPPQSRLSPRDMSIVAKTIHRLITEHYYPVGEGAQCRFCGEGTYRRYPDQRMRLGHGRGGEGNVNFRVLICNSCAHVEWFFAPQ